MSKLFFFAADDRDHHHCNQKRKTRKLEYPSCLMETKNRTAQHGLYRASLPDANKASQNETHFYIYRRSASRTNENRDLRKNSLD